MAVMWDQILTSPKCPNMDTFVSVCRQSSSDVYKVTNVKGLWYTNVQLFTQNCTRPKQTAYPKATLKGVQPIIII